MSVRSVRSAEGYTSFRGRTFCFKLLYQVVDRKNHALYDVYNKRGGGQNADRD